MIVCVWSAADVTLTAQEIGSSAALKSIDLQGQPHRLCERQGTKLTVVAFMSTQCPISNSYVPTLNQIFTRHRDQSVEFYGVISDPSVTRAEALAHSREYAVEFPVLFDGSGELRLALRPTHTPQVVVLGRSGKQVYSGAIDDRFVKLGQRKPIANKRYLSDAVTATLFGRPVAVPKTKPIGCLLEDPPNKAIAGPVTFARDIAPIIQANCVCCHHPQGSAPFSLLSYAQVSGHANQIGEVTQSRFMPPWKPAHGFTRFQDEQSLSEHEISLLDRWLSSGKPAGDPDDMPVSPTFAADWQLGQPDLILEMADLFSIPASGPDIRQYFVIPTKLTADRLITAIDFQPGATQAVHHASFFIDTTGTGRSLDAADPGPGYEGFGGPQLPSQGTLMSWFPGMSPRRLPLGMGRKLTRNSDIVAEIHYVATGKPERDRSKIGLYFAEPTAQQLVVEIQVGTKRIEIPPGQPRHRERAFYTLPVDTTLLDMVPHMHLLGREMKVWADSPDGGATPLLWIKDWDFNWQGQYSFARPVHLAKGTRICVDAWFDNSSENPLNPNSPPKLVRWGEDATDEMLICCFQCTCASTAELVALQTHQSRYIQGARGR
jgi:hypothetical protein